MNVDGVCNQVHVEEEKLAKPLNAQQASIKGRAGSAALHNRKRRVANYHPHGFADGNYASTKQSVTELDMLQVRSANQSFSATASNHKGRPATANVQPQPHQHT